MNNSSKPKILLLDLCSEKNRGDAAMQVGLIKLVQNYFPQADISAVTVFGANQIREIPKEYDHSLKYPIHFLGGLKPTFFPLGDKAAGSKLWVEFLNFFFLVVSSILLLLLACKVPATLIMRILPGNFRETFCAIQDADLVFWNGRNFRSRKNRLLEAIRIYNVVYHPLLCQFLAKPIVCVGASLWELNGLLSKRLLRTVFKKCEYVTFRESYSYNSAINLLGHPYEKKIHLLPDLSFAVFDNIGIHLQRREQASNAKLPEQVGITIVDWSGCGRAVRSAYAQMLIETIRYLIANGSKISIVPQVIKIWEDCHNIWQDIFTSLSDSEKEQVSVVDGEPGVDDLLDIYSKMDLMIATRLHSAIFACAVQTPLVAISYDSGGKWGILDNIGYKHFIVPYSESNSQKLIEKISECWNNKETILKTVRKNTQESIQQVERNVSLALDVIN